jgi:hypothetical protein
VRHPAVLVLVPILLIACAQPAATARIEGRVLAGPTCPVESPGAECDPVPWTGTVRATGEDGGVYETETDDGGAYAIDLPPGTYVVVAVTGSGAPPTGVPQTVPVVEGQPLRVDLEVDTGIR